METQSFLDDAVEMLRFGHVLGVESRLAVEQGLQLSAQLLDLRWVLGQVVEDERQSCSSSVGTADNGQSGIAAQPLVIDIPFLGLVVSINEMRQNLLLC